MKKKNSLFKIVSTFVVFSIGASFAFNFKNTPTRVEATPYLGDFAPYTYSGSYYDSINFDAAGGMNGALRTSLTSLIKPAGFYTYGSTGETHLATQLQYADEDPTNSNNMIYLYTRDSVKKNAASSWNREHVWPQSLSSGNWGTSEGGTDILHLRPTYGSVNSSRGNTPYGNSNHVTRKTYEGMDYGYTGNGYFEPLDEVKGDVARIVMYLWTTYTGWSGYSSLNILKVFQSYDTLLQWHTEDKPDALEGNRNDYCQTSRQKNRNPFVDHPELAWKIFGDNASNSVKNACIAAYPATSSGGDPITPTSVSINKTSANLSVGKTLQLSVSLQPTGATGTVTWSSNATSVATVNSTGLVTAQGTGTATITASINGLTAICSVTVGELNNDYGTQENPLSITDAKEIIDINGTSESAQPLYVKGIVSSNSAFNTQYNNYDYVWLQSEDGKTAKAFELYRTKLSSSVTGSYSSANSLVGYEVVAYGYGKIYGTTYELCQVSNNTPKYPEILSVELPEATAITLNKSTAEIDAGGSITLTASLVPSNASSTIVWESSDEDVATVSNGTVRGVSAGTAVITATVSEDIQAECVVTVVGSATVSSDELTINLNTNETTTATENEISWANSDIYSIVCVKASGGTNANNYYGGDSNNRTSTRFYKNSTLTITPAAGITITSVEFTATTNDYASALKNSTWTNASASVSSTKVTITPVDGAISFSAVIGATCGFTSIKLFYDIYSSGESNPLEYLNSASSVATIYGNEGTSEQAKTGSIKFSELNLSNGVQYTDPFNIDNGTATVTFSGGGNDGKYYNTGSGIRTYGDGSIIISSSYVITSIEFTWSGSDNTPSSNDIVDVGTYNASTGIWEGEEHTITLTRPTGSGHWRLQKVSVTYIGNVLTVSSVALRFGARFEKDDWDNMASEFTIKDYGVMMFKRLDDSTIPNLTVKQAFEDGKQLATVRNGSGSAPYFDTENNQYVFNAKINVSNPNNYGVVFVSAPFVVIDDGTEDGKYYFLDEMEFSVKTLAQYYIGDISYSYLTQSALSTLAAS